MENLNNEKNEYHQVPFQSSSCKGVIIYLNRREINVKGIIDGIVEEGMITFKAANPMDRMSSFSGSGFPFANFQQAFENTPNSGRVELSSNNMFDIDIIMPNAYYIGLGTVLVPPTVFLEFSNGEGKISVPIEVNNPVPYRTLTYPIYKNHISRNSALFYDVMKDLPVRTQEQILRDSAYPSTQHRHISLPGNFWGAKPPV